MKFSAFVGVQKRSNKKRQRVYQLVDADGVPVPDAELEVIENEAPLPAPPDGFTGSWKILWDIDIESHTVVTPHVETQDAGTVADATT